MKCENCGMGFYLTTINVNIVCPHCGHIHGNSEVLNKEDNMVKKVVKWIWNIIAWPFKKIHNWLNG